VGVVEDARYRDAREVPPPMAYHPAEFDPQEVLIRDLEIRTAGSPAMLAQTVRSVLAESEPRLPVTEVLPLSERLTRGLSKDRLVAELTSAFGVLALLLAALGLYGTTSYGISRRTAELGLRMALGAERASVLTMVLREALAVVLIGAAVGAPLAFAAARSVGTLLYGVPPADVLSYAGAAVVLVTVSAVAAYLPAYRASRIEPLAALNRS
jgi:predicted lysophospholipase L1 biosynthesis ABC-type transport system permease subunit